VREAFGVEVGLRELFESPTIEGLSEKIEKQLRTGEGRREEEIRRVERREGMELSFAQQRLWFIEQLEGASALYNVPIALRLEGELKVAALERTINEIIRRHETLRTTFTQRAGEAVQEIHAAEEMKIAVEEGHLAVAERGEAVLQEVRQEAGRPFDLSIGPLLRVRVLRLAEQEHVVMVTMHHIVSDGWSMGVLVKEVASLYEAYREGRESPLEELKIQYADYAAWQREQLQGEELSRQVEYWKQQLAGAPTHIELATDRVRPAVPTFRGMTQSILLPEQLSRALKKLSNE